jgi:dTDP-4-dehydrorhamnose 3,5-epimerase
LVAFRQSSKLIHYNYFAVLYQGKIISNYLFQKGFLHGFFVLEDNTISAYKCDNYYSKESEDGVFLMTHS